MREARLNRWSAVKLTAAAALALLGLFITFDGWADILHIAYVDEEASHIFLVLPICAWLIWVRRLRLRYCKVRPSYLGAAIVAAGWAMSAFGYRNSVQALFHAGSVVVVVGCVITVLGRDLLLRFLPAFFVLVFLVPVPGRIRQKVSIPMMGMTARVTQTVSEYLGVPVERSGNQLSINGKPVGIIEACNGLRMVFALVLVSYAFAFGEPLRNYVRLIILVASPISAMLCNVVRLVPTLWMYGYAHESVADQFHNFAGWAMLGVAFLVLMGIIRVLRWAMIPVGHYTLAASG